MNEKKPKAAEAAFSAKSGELRALAEETITEWFGEKHRARSEAEVAFVNSVVPESCPHCGSARIRKDEIGDKIAACETDGEAFAVIDEWFDYYNDDRPIWSLRRMTPVEAYGHFLATGEIVAPKKCPKKRKAA